MRLFVRIYTSLIRNDTQCVCYGSPPADSSAGGLFMLGNRAGFFATLFPGTHERKWRRQIAAVLYQLVLRLFMDVYFSNHTFTCSMLYSPVMIAVWSFMATNRTLS